MGPLTAAGVVAAVAGGLLAARRFEVADRLKTRLGKGLAPPAPPADEDTPEACAEREPGRGREAGAPTAIPKKGWMDIAWRVGLSYFGDRLGFISAGVTFFVVLSLFPTLLMIVTFYGLIFDASNAWDHIDYLRGVLPRQIADFIGNEMQRLSIDRGATLSLTLAGTTLLSLWTASGAVRTLFYGLNVAYHETEKRNVIKYALICLAFTAAAIAAVVLALALVVGAPLLLEPLRLTAEVQALEPLRWPLLAALYIAAMTAIYRYGPCRQRARWRWVTPGGIFAAVGALAVSAAFSWYINELADFRRSYGSLGAMMAFMLWVWFSVQIILLGAKLNAEIEHQTAVDTTTGHPMPMGQRGAVVADTLGARRGATNAWAFTMKHAEELSRRLTLRRRRPDQD
ncbi:YihY/virulence factor BrkB family protein [Brevundimonas sp. 2R-24]|uniref:YihY/virulence factor BrkB family protein n=1 Tax=Peiella sedimenti TaxID=3061083 RepID=A0ABT8SNV7_9CAUL|nr:YihY/virulence factor BrkB family protein [Caulobacteraceae bacterium XZ-24]